MNVSFHFCCNEGKMQIPSRHRECVGKDGPKKGLNDQRGREMRNQNVQKDNSDPEKHLGLSAEKLI